MNTSLNAATAIETAKTRGFTTKTREDIGTRTVELTTETMNGQYFVVLSASIKPGGKLYYQGADLYSASGYVLEMYSTVRQFTDALAKR